MMSGADQSQSSNGGGGGSGGGDGRPPLFVMQSMQSPSERYLSSESLENDRNSTTSSTESPNSGGVIHRKDHEFIPTRQKTITASRPAADPGKFTKVPSNPLLISAQKQIMQAEEIRRRKESAREKAERAAAAAAAAADGPPKDDFDWQSNLSSWKNRRRKQSEEALQRVAEVKALEDAENSGEPRKISMSRKLSSLLYTSGEDLDWNEMVGEEKEEEEASVDMNGGGSGDGNRSDTAADDRVVPEVKAQPSKSPEPLPEWAPESNKVQNWTEVIRNDAPKAAVNSSVATYAQRNNAKNSIGSTWEEQQAAANKLAEKQAVASQSAAAVRRKSSEMSQAMRDRLEAFNSGGGGGSFDEEDGAVSPVAGREHKTSGLTAGVIEPDHKFQQKLMAFRKISEGKLDVPKEALKPKPPQSISSLLAGSTSQTRTGDSSTEKPNDDFDNDTLDDVDQLLDDALEESYRSVLEEKNRDNHGDNKMMFHDDDFGLGGKGARPPSEKPPPPPPEEGVKRGNELADDEIDQQERQIIASLEMEEREHNRYIMEQTRKRTPVAANNHSNTSTNGDSGLGTSSVKKTDKAAVDAKNNQSSAQSNHQQPARKRTPNEQRTYNQHWLIQEAEQRRLAEQRQTSITTTTTATTSPQQQKPAVATAGSGSPYYENSQYVNQRLVPQPSPPAQQQPAYPPPSQHQQQQRGMVSPSHQNENVYANLGSQQGVAPPPPPPHHPHMPTHPGYHRDGRIPGPQVPPRNSHDHQIPGSAGSGGERVLSVSGKKLCSHCNEELGRGAAMIIESLRLYYHLRCFQCCVCHIQLGNGAQGTDVRVRNNKLHCQNCYSNDEGLKFSKV